jgi:hypothetical protein
MPDRERSRIACSWDTTETRRDGSSLAFETEFTFEERDSRTLKLREEHRRGVPRAFLRFARHSQLGGTAAP